ncbi:MAG TPA: ATP-binding protein, partial [Puia sp.]|nr:ATP-binding protein [Puia sp.]
AITFWFFSLTTLWSQTSIINDLRKNLYSAQQNKLSVLFELCKQGSSLSSDSFMLYAQQAKQISILKNNFSDRLLSEFFIGKCYIYEGKADSALQICETNLKQVTDISSSYNIYHQLWGLKITCLTKLRKFDETFAQSYKLLESGAKYNDLSAQIFASNAIGSAYFNFSSDFINTKKWWMQAYHLMEGSAVFNDFPQVLTNLSYLYYGIDSNSFGIKNNNIDSAQFFLDKAFIVAQQTQSIKVFADCYATQADIYNLQHKKAEAEKMLQKGLLLYKQIGNAASIIDGLGSLADFYEDQKNFTEAIVYQKQEEEYLSKSHSGQLTEFYRSFAANYEKVGNYVMADSMLRKFIHIQDSLYAKTKVEDLAQLETKYQLSNKEADIAKQKLELLHKDIWNVVAVFFVVLIITATYLQFRYAKRKQLIALKDAEEKERKRIAADLHDNIGAYASAISAGIDEIESKKLVSDVSSVSNLKSNATEIITSLRDTIWAFNKESITLTGISDRIKTHTQKIQPAYPQIQISIEENISKEKKLSPVQALHIFRIVQEALQNALRHSNCNKIVINIFSNDELTSISIDDNGKGFDPERVQNAGNGLINMKTRAAESGFKISFEKNIPTGIKVLIAGK